jgi:hypothetical protein
MIFSTSTDTDMNPIIRALTVAAVILTAATAAAQSTPAIADTIFARYLVIKQTAPGSENACSEEYTDEYGLLEQSLVCTGEPNRTAKLSAELPLYRKHPPVLIDGAIEAIAAGTLTGAQEKVVDGVRHHVRWKATNADDIEIEETLTRLATGYSTLVPPVK